MNECIESRISSAAVCVPVHWSMNVCNEIMKRQIDFIPRTAERSIIVDWLRILDRLQPYSPSSLLPCESSRMPEEPQVIPTGKQ